MNRITIACLGLLSSTAVALPPQRLPRPVFTVPGALSHGGSTYLDLDHGDIDGDGILDFVTTSSTGIYRLRGDGLGGLGPAEPLLPTTVVGGVAGGGSLGLGDFDGDGDLDMFASITREFSFFSHQSYTLSLIHDGTGNFVPGTPVPELPITVAGVADYDGDGNVDVALLRGVLEIRPGLGNGTFGSSIFFPTANPCSGIASTDLDQDGRLDLIATTYSFSLQKWTLKRFLQTSPLQFSEAQVADSAAELGAPRVLDYDQDGDLDFAVPSRSPASGSTWQLRVYPTQGIDLGAPIDVGPLTAQQSWLADLDGDGDFDLFQPAKNNEALAGTNLADLNGDLALEVVTRVENGVTMTLAGSALAESVPTSVVPNPLAAGTDDLDSDGFNDILLASTQALTIGLGDGSGTFATAASLALADGTTKRVVGARFFDIDGDGARDFEALVTDGSTNPVGLSLVLVRTMGVGFASPVQITLPYSGPVNGSSVAFSMTSEDVDGDGRVDPAVLRFVPGANSFTEVIVVLGADTANPNWVASPLLYGPLTGAVLADLTGDGKVDLSLGLSNDFRIYPGNGAGGFSSPPTTLSLGWTSGAIPADIRITLEDFDGDGIRDAVVTGIGVPNGAPTVPMQRVAPGIAGGGLGPFTVADWVPMASGVAGVDFDGDGNRDLVATSNGLIWVLPGDGALGFGAPRVTAVPNSVLADIADIDGDGRLDLLAVGSGFVETLTELCAGASGAYGSGCAGSNGLTPRLGLQGCVASGENARLVIDRGRTASIAVLVFGATQAASPIPGGCSLLVGNLLPLAVTIPLDGSGAASIAASLGVVPSGGFRMQAFVADPGIVGGLAATNAVRVIVD